LTFKFDPAKPAGSRVSEVKVNGLTIDPFRFYSVATNDFTAAGGDGYTMFKDAKVLYMSGEMLRDVAIKYIKGQEIAPKVEGRISIVK
ncbi:MAG TPA: 5'-nucleotidase C-terminal domain-containing protein, partial [Bacillota bacterium]|nr:5'-nucleotidase C-terminal domain-containing protein [Bacillota bacterium]